MTRTSKTHPLIRTDSIPQSLHPESEALLLHPKPHALNPTPYTQTPRTKHPTIYPTPYTLHPTLYTLHPTPYTLHLTPYTLHPKLQTPDPKLQPLSFGPPPKPAPRMLPAQSKECVAAKKLTSSAAIRSASVRTSTRRSLGVTRTHVTGSPIVSLHSRNGRKDEMAGTDLGSAGPPPATTRNGCWPVACCSAPGGRGIDSHVQCVCYSAGSKVKGFKVQDLRHRV